MNILLTKIATYSLIARHRVWLKLFVKTATKLHLIVERFVAHLTISHEKQINVKSSFI